MRGREERERVDELAELATLLRSDQLPVQQEIALATGVAQPIVSRARNSKLSRITDKVLALLEYARAKASAEQVAAAAAAAIDQETSQTPRPHRARQPRAPGGTPADGRRHEKAPFAADALKGVKEYLEEGYDPRLIVEQLVVLRRAQQVRRAGRPRAVAPERSS